MDEDNPHSAKAELKWVWDASTVYLSSIKYGNCRGVLLVDLGQSLQSSACERTWKKVVAIIATERVNSRQTQLNGSPSTMEKEKVRCSRTYARKVINL